mgnify:CR=1 FL=1
MLLNDGDVADLHRKVCNFLPMWCNLTTAVKAEECQCVKCRMSRENKGEALEEILENLLDLLDLKDWQEEEDDEEAY